MTEPWQVFLFLYSIVCGIVGGMVGSAIYLWFDDRCKTRRSGK